MFVVSEESGVVGQVNQRVRVRVVNALDFEFLEQPIFVLMENFFTLRRSVDLRTTMIEMRRDERTRGSNRNQQDSYSILKIEFGSCANARAGAARRIRENGQRVCNVGNVANHSVNLGVGNRDDLK
jgi:hypothetical protein